MGKKNTEHWNENFYGKDLRGKDFSGHFFYRCCFQASIMDETTNFRAAAFQNCNLTLAEAGKANFSKAVIHYSDLSYADFEGANFNFARIQWTNVKGARFSGADLRGVETDRSKFLNTKFDGAKLTGWSREIIAEILRQQTDDLQLKMIAAWIASEDQMCWEQFMGVKGLPEIKPSLGKLFSILRSFGLGDLIDNGGLLCHQQQELAPPQELRCLQPQPQPLSAEQ